MKLNKKCLLLLSRSIHMHFCSGNSGKISQACGHFTGSKHWTWVFAEAFVEERVCSGHLKCGSERGRGEKFWKFPSHSHPFSAWDTPSPQRASSINQWPTFNLLHSKWLHGSAIFPESPMQKNHTDLELNK